MIEYCEKYKHKENQGIDEPFVLAYDHSPLTAENNPSVESDSDEDESDEESDQQNAPNPRKGPWIRFLVTTQRLLTNSAVSNIICTDSTHKIVIQRYPIIVFGTTDLDANQHFHLLGVLISRFEQSDDFEFGFKALKNGIENVVQ